MIPNSNGSAAHEAARRRTFAVISHPDAGKSTLTEALALHAHAITRAGAVHGKAGRRRVASDWMEMEKARGISVTAAVLQFAHRGCVLNLLDTPGHADFSEDTYRVLAAVDCAVMLIDAAKGLEEQTRKLFTRDLSFPAVRWNGPTRPMDDEARWDTARRPAARRHPQARRPPCRPAVAPLCNGPPRSPGSPSTTSRRRTQAPASTSAPSPSNSRPPSLTSPSKQVTVPCSHATLARTNSPWLFPGGQPGRPISAWAMGERLRKLGIRLAEARSTALFQLATELPAAVLACTLGIDITVAVKWQRAAAGDWAAYAAEASRRNST